MALLVPRLETEQCGVLPLQRTLDFFEDLGSGIQVLGVEPEAALRIVLDGSIRVSGGSQMDVLDCVLGQPRGKRCLRKPGPARERQSANIHNSRYAGALERGHELRQSATLVANRVEVLAGHVLHESYTSENALWADQE